MRKIIEFCDNNAIHPRPMYILSVGHEGNMFPGTRSSMTLRTR